jgi:polysaccharide export outer membrane protein
MTKPLSAFLILVLCAPLAAQTPAGAPVITQGSAAYALRPGDIVRIDVWGQTEYSGQFQVDEEGMLHYPVIGSIRATDLTIGMLRDTLRAGLEELFTNPFVTITPLFRIAVLGRVQRPGLYTVDPTLSVLDIVALAGGAASGGNLNRIRVLRAGATTQLSYEREALAGRSLQQIGVRSGDEVIVPRSFFTRDDLTVVLLLAQIALTVVVLVNTTN